MTSQSLTSTSPAGAASLSGRINSAGFLRENPEMILAAITLVALLTGWIGGEMTGALPAWAVTVAAWVAFLAGGYSGVTGAWEEARKGRLDIDFLMIAAALGAALIGAWVEGALLLFLFTLSGARLPPSRWGIASSSSLANACPSTAPCSAAPAASTRAPSRARACRCTKWPATKSLPAR